MVIIFVAAEVAAVVVVESEEKWMVDVAVPWEWCHEGKQEQL